MKIGILSFHSQLNYGGVLQCYALQSVLKSMGHDVYVVDRWLDRYNTMLMGFWLKSKCKFLIRPFLLCGQEFDTLRSLCTIRFIKKYLHLTPYHFVDWDDAPDALKEFDCFVVGSDQVWHIDWPLTKFYFLSDSFKVPAIAYAASIGMKEIPEHLQQDFTEGLRRFQAIGVRESSAKDLLKTFGFDSVHVADPVLLAPSAIWEEIARKMNQNNERRIFCYFMEDKVLDIYPVLKQYADKMHVHIDVFLNSYAQCKSDFPTSITKIKQWLKLKRCFLSKNVHIHAAGGPAEWVQSLENSTDVITDSFHGLMFSIVFNKNVRIIKPQTAIRQFMFSRITEMQKYLIHGNFIVSSLEHALQSVFDDEHAFFNQDKLNQCCVPHTLY